MRNYKHLEIEEDKSIMTVWLNRPLVHNAFNEEVINELFDFFSDKNLKTKRAVVLRGRGKSFCAGADLVWMKSVVNYEYKQNLEESIKLSQCFYSIYTCPIPTIAIVQGNAIGGANGFLSACDMAYTTPDTNFSLSEVKIGLTPACISPYVIKRVGEFTTRELMLTGKRFNGNEAKRYGLVNDCIPSDQIEKFLEKLLFKIKTAGPEAIKVTKVLIDNVINNISFEAAKQYTAEIIAHMRKSDEGQEGMNSFLEKRKPNWNEEN